MWDSVPSKLFVLFPRPEVATSSDTMSIINEFRKTLREQKTKKCECK